MCICYFWFLFFTSFFFFIFCWFDDCLALQSNGISPIKHLAKAPGPAYGKTIPHQNVTSNGKDLHQFQTYTYIPCLNAYNFLDVPALMFWLFSAWEFTSHGVQTSVLGTTIKIWVNEVVRQACLWALSFWICLGEK